MILPNLRRLSDKELAALRDRTTSPIKLTDERLRAIAQVMREYQRRGYSPTALAYLPRNKSGPGFLNPGPDNE
jgi:hypothetical protein